MGCDSLIQLPNLGLREVTCSHRSRGIGMIRRRCSCPISGQITKYKPDIIIWEIEIADKPVTIRLYDQHVLEYALMVQFPTIPLDRWHTTEVRNWYAS